ncbi:hypothetical protein CANINC_001663 [Pichia inconspicua]|uniref:Uncharacterized protein n=1 Tax=Pichia inconspicua TaxID=52247 RepID=A0A4T0X3G8_9ASCO|nr:hypothetical protein CANINC_001663 [[Candida] inconspicua]
MFKKQFLKVRSRKGSCFRSQFASYSSYSSSPTKSSSGKNIDQFKVNGLNRAVNPNKPYFHLNYPISISVNEFKKNYLNIGNKLDDEIVEAFKKLVEKIVNEYGNDYRISMIQDTNQDLIDEMIMAASELQIVDILEFCCSKRFMIKLSEKSLAKLNLFYNRAKLINRYKVLTTNYSETKVSFADFRKRLTYNQRETIKYTYSPQLIKLFITQIYLPLRDIEKIEEYLEILECQEDPKELIRFRTILHSIMFNQPLSLNITSASSIEKTVEMLSDYLISPNMIPRAMRTEFHSHIICHCMRNCSLQQIREYLALFYPKFLDSSVERTQDLLSETNLLSLVDDDYPNITIKQAFFEKVLTEDKTSLFEELMGIAVRKGKFERLLNFVLLEHNLERTQDNISVETLEAYEIPYFNNAYLQNLSDYYSNDFSKILGFIERNNEPRTLTASEIDRLLSPLNTGKRDILFRALISNQFNFCLQSPILNWIGESTENFDFVITGGNTHISPENLQLAQALKILSPNSILNCLTKTNSKYTNSLLQLLPMKSNYHYILKRMQLLDITSYPKNASYVELLAQFLGENNVDSLTDRQLLEIYHTYIFKVISKNSFQGLKVAMSLIPSYKTTLLKLLGLKDSSELNPLPRSLKLHETVPKEIVLEYIKASAHQIENFDSAIIPLFRNVINVVPDLKLGTNKSGFLKQTLLTFADLCIEKNISPLILFRIYKTSLAKGLDPNWRIDDSNIISRYVQRYVETYNSSDKTQESENLTEILAAVSNFQNWLELNADAVKTIFSSVSEEEKISTLNVLIKTLVYIPYVESIADFIYQQVEEDNKKIYESIGIVYSNPSVSDPETKFYKWPKFDPRYFAPFMKKFMENILTKDTNITIRRMLNDSLANMKCNDDYYACRNFADLYEKVSFFENAANTSQSTNLETLIESVKLIQTAPKPAYLDDPFIINYLVSKGSTYKLETIVQMLYILTRGDSYLRELGFWEGFDIPNIPPEFKDSPKLYKEMTESKLLNLYRLLFTSVKFSDSLTANELSYFTNISENIMNCDLLGKKNKYMVINCVLIIIEKHSDLLSTFYKKMINVFPEYRVSAVILGSLLHSVAKNDFGEIDGILRHLVKNNDMSYLNQASEASINKLLLEKQDGLAQELYLKFCEFNPRFKMQEFADLNWIGNNPRTFKQKSQKTESEQDKKLGKFKVKLYDYDALDGNNSL